MIFYCAGKKTRGEGELYQMFCAHLQIDILGFFTCHIFDLVKISALSRLSYWFSDLSRFLLCRRHQLVALWFSLRTQYYSHMQAE